jgi:invasion protein IalB
VSTWAKVTVAVVLLLLIAAAGVGFYVMRSEGPTLSTKTQPTQARQPNRASANSDWRVRCGKSACVAQRSIYRKNTRSPIISVAVRVPRDSQPATLRFRLPLNISIPSGAAFQIGSSPRKLLVLQRCEKDGCMADHAITESEISALSNGESLKVSVWNREKAQVDFQVPTSGFAKAYAQFKKSGAQ